MTTSCKLHITEGTREGEALKIMAFCANINLPVAQHKPDAGFEKSVPFGELPSLEVDLQQYTQTVPILRYFARQCGFVPSDPAEELEAEMIASAVEQFRVCPKAMIPTLEEEKAPAEGGPGEMRGLMRGMRGLGRAGRRGGRGMRRGGRMQRDEDSGGAGPMRRMKQRHGINPMSGIRRNPFDLKENSTLANGPGFVERASSPIHKKPKKARDYLISFTRHLESNLDGTDFLVGNRMTFADFSLFSELRRHLLVQKEFLRNFPLLHSWYEKLAGSNELKAYCANPANS